MVIKKVSSWSGKLNTVDIPITVEELQQWQQGPRMIQEVFPHLLPWQREFLLTGMTEEEWEEMTMGGWEEYV